MLLEHKIQIAKSHRGQANLARLQEIIQAPRGCDHNLDAILQVPQLGTLRGAAVAAPASGDHNIVPSLCTKHPRCRPLVVVTVFHTDEHRDRVAHPYDGVLTGAIWHATSLAP